MTEEKYVFLHISVLKPSLNVLYIYQHTTLKNTQFLELPGFNDIQYGRYSIDMIYKFWQIVLKIYQELGPSLKAFLCLVSWISKKKLNSAYLALPPPPFLFGMCLKVQLIVTTWIIE